MDNAFEYATDHYMCSEENVPYEAKTDKTLNEWWLYGNDILIENCDFSG